MIDEEKLNNFMGKALGDLGSNQQHFALTSRKKSFLKNRSRLASPVPVEGIFYVAFHRPRRLVG